MASFTVYQISISSLHTCEIRKFQEVLRRSSKKLLSFTEKHPSKDKRQSFRLINSLSLSIFLLDSFFLLAFHGLQFRAAILANFPSLHSFQILIVVPVGTGIRGDGRIKQRKRNIAEAEREFETSEPRSDAYCDSFLSSLPPSRTDTHTCPLLNFRPAEDSTISGRGRLKLR